MAMTDAQLVVFKAAILAETDPELVAARDGGANTLVATFYNAEGSPPVVVWKSLVHQDEIMRNGMDWTRVIALSDAEARAWEWMFDNAEQAIDPSKPNIRAGIDATWDAPGDAATRDAVYAHCKRNATRGEALFASGGTGTTEAPHTADFEGLVTDQDVARALALP